MALLIPASQVTVADAEALIVIEPSLLVFLQMITWKQLASESTMRKNDLLILADTFSTYFTSYECPRAVRPGWHNNKYNSTKNIENNGGNKAAMP